MRETENQGREEEEAGGGAIIVHGMSGQEHHPDQG